MDLAKLAALSAQEEQLSEQLEDSTKNSVNTVIPEKETIKPDTNDKISDDEPGNVEPDKKEKGRQFVQYFSNNVKQIPVSKLVAYERHSFKPLPPKAFDELKSDIAKLGMHEPVLVREKPDGTFEIISGHNRKRIAENLGVDFLPCRIANKLVTDEIADEIMVATNLNRKNTFSHSELAKSIKIIRESRNRQGFRSDLVENPQGSIEEEFGISSPQIRRYLRIATLIPELLEMIDYKKLPMYAGVELSYISHEHQSELFKIIKNNELSVSWEASQKIRKLAENNNFDEVKIISLLKLQNDKAEKTKSKKISITLDKYSELFTRKSDDELNRIIEAALDMYFGKQR